MSNEEKLSEQPVSQISTNKDFIGRCQEMGFKKIGDILAVKPAELVAKNGFSYHWLEEIVNFLSKNKALHLLQAIPGKSPG